MRTRQLFIDGVDAATTYGVFVVEGGYDGIAQWPEMQEPEHVNWPEEDGIEPDLLTTTLKAKDSIRLDIACTNAPTGSDAFIALLQSESYHLFDFREIGVAIPMRYKSVSNRTIVGSLETMTLEMAFDYGFLDEVKPYEPSTPYLTFKGRRLMFNEKLLVFTYYEDGLESHTHLAKKATGLMLDGVDFGEFNCLALEGTDEAITRPAPLKDNLIIKARGVNGQLYPDQTAVKGAKIVSVPMLMRGVNPPLFWVEYLRLLDAITSAGSHTLTWKGKDYRFYYQNQALQEFTKFGDNVVWCQFAMSLCFYLGE